jgi:hypothetical protein
MPSVRITIIQMIFADNIAGPGKGKLSIPLWNNCNIETIGLSLHNQMNL